MASAGAQLNRIRKIVATNLFLGLVVVIIASFGGASPMTSEEATQLPGINVTRARIARRVCNDV